MKYYIYHCSAIGGKLIGIAENEKEKEILIDNFCTKKADEVINKTGIPMNAIFNLKRMERNHISVLKK